MRRVLVTFCRLPFASITPQLRRHARTTPQLRRHARTKIELRPYQQDAINAMREHMRGKGGSALVVLPPGTGKSLLQAELIRSVISSNPEARVMALTHSKELCAQNRAELDLLWPEKDRMDESGEPQHTIGIYSAGLGSRKTSSQITFATIQSVHSLDDAEQQDFDAPPADLIVVDEAQALSRDPNSRYSLFIARAKAKNPNLQLVGLTATPYRLDSGMLTEPFTESHQIDGKKVDVTSPPLFDKLVFEYKFIQAVEEGWLCDLISRQTSAQLDLSSLSSSVSSSESTDFRDQDLQKIIDTDEITEQIADEMVMQGQGRNHWLVFCTGILHAQNMAMKMTQKGIECKAVYGSMKTSERDSIIKDFRSGKLRAVTNVGVLSTGFNVPEVDLVALLRPTKSTALYVQMVGRGSRVAQGKKSCLVLDFAGNIERHGLLEDCAYVKPSVERGATVLTKPYKMCEGCGTFNANRVEAWVSCGKLFADEKLVPKASSAPLHGGSRKVQRYKVLRVAYYLHHKKGHTQAKPTMRVGYQCSPEAINEDGQYADSELYGSNYDHHEKKKPRWFTEWICLEHAPGTYMKKKADIWWGLRAPLGLKTVPKSIRHALHSTDMLMKPTTIAVKSGKFAEITPEFDDFVSKSVKSRRIN